jgi:hypothetical protein
MGLAGRIFRSAITERFTAVAVSAAAVFFLGLAACTREVPGPPSAAIAPSGRIVITGFPASDLDAFAVRVRHQPSAMAGKFAAARGLIEFTPAFPLEPGREYEVTGPRGFSTIVSLPARDKTPVTTVSGIHPAAMEWPANTLRVYVQFSRPMSSGTGAPYVKLKDDAGKEVELAFLPVEADLWSGDRTRYTVFFDPGRVKQGILPNRQLGRALVAGKSYVLEIDAKWPDAEGRPLVAPYRREFRVGPAVEKALSVESWKITAPAADSRAPLVLTFPWPIDHGLVERALSITGPDGRTVNGKHALEPGDVRWVFTPAEPWRAGEYRLTALPILEDPSGNQIGRAFEVDMNKASPTPVSVKLSRTFTIAKPEPSS